MLFRSVLAKAWEESTWQSEREHVTSYIWKHSEIFRIGELVYPDDHSGLRWTVDQAEDLAFVRRVCRALSNRPISFQAVLDVVSRHPEFAAINLGIGTNEGYRKSLAEDRIVKAGEVVQ